MKNALRKREAKRVASKKIKKLCKSGDVERGEGMLPAKQTGSYLKR